MSDRGPPRPLLSKLGIAEGGTVRIIGEPDLASATFLGELADVPGVTLKRSGSAFDACLLFITKNADLTKLRALAAPVTRSRAFIWVVYAKGRKDPREADVRAAGLAAGLVDVKVASFSPTHTALKFTARREKR